MTAEKETKLPAAGQVLNLPCWCGANRQVVVTRNRWKGFCVVRCEQCSTHHNFPRPVAGGGAPSAFYREFSLSPDQHRRAAEGSAVRYLDQLRSLMAGTGLPAPHGLRVLDAGCGCGQFAEILRRAGFDAEGLDPDPGCIEIARGLYPGIPFHAGHLASLDAGAYDLITCMHAMEHVSDPLAFARAVCARLAPGGLYLGVVPNIASVAFAVLRSYWMKHLAPGEHVTHFCPVTLEQLLARAGFKMLRWRCCKERLLPPKVWLERAVLLIPRREFGSLFRFSCYCVLENVARITTALARRPDAGQNLFFAARKPERTDATGGDEAPR